MFARMFMFMFRSHLTHDVKNVIDNINKHFRKVFKPANNN